MRTKYKGTWSMKVDGLWWDEKNYVFTDKPDFERGGYSTNYDSHFKKHLKRKVDHLLHTKDKLFINILYWTTKNGKRVLKEWTVSK